MANEKKGTAQSTTDKAREAAGDLKDRAQETAQNLAERASDTASNVASRAGEMASNVANRAGEMASSAGRRADSAASSAGRGMESFADTVRDYGPSSGMLGSATSAVADTIEGAGDYLEQHGLSGVASDLTDMVRRNPIPALLLGIGLGFLIARATRS
jgi:cell division septum initiation protein DivIVA